MSNVEKLNSAQAETAVISITDDERARERVLRETVQFETAAPRLLWLNDKVAVGTGTREPGGPVYDIWEIA